MPTRSAPDRSPAISCGVYGYPVRAATEVAVTTVLEVSTEVEVVRFVCFGPEIRSAYDDLLG